MRQMLMKILKLTIVLASTGIGYYGIYLGISFVAQTFCRADQGVLVGLLCAHFLSLFIIGGIGLAVLAMSTGLTFFEFENQLNNLESGKSENE